MPQLRDFLYHGDKLDILPWTELVEVRRYVDDESVDLVYLDPLFHSNADYNVLFTEQDRRPAHAPKARPITRPTIANVVVSIRMEVHL